MSVSRIESPLKKITAFKDFAVSLNEFLANLDSSHGKALFIELASQESELLSNPAFYTPSSRQHIQRRPVSIFERKCAAAFSKLMWQEVVAETVSRIVGQDKQYDSTDKLIRLLLNTRLGPEELQPVVEQLVGGKVALTPGSYDDYQKLFKDNKTLKFVDFEPFFTLVSNKVDFVKAFVNVCRKLTSEKELSCLFRMRSLFSAGEIMACVDIEKLAVDCTDLSMLVKILMQFDRGC